MYPLCFCSDYFLAVFCQSSIFYFVQKLWGFDIVSDFLQRLFVAVFFYQSSIFYFVQKLWGFDIVSDFLQRLISRCIFVNRVFFILFRNSDDLALSLIFCSDHFLAVFCQSSIFILFRNYDDLVLPLIFCSDQFLAVFLSIEYFYFVQKLWWFGIVSDFLQRPFSRCIFVNRVFFILFRNSDDLVLSLIFCSDHFLAVFLSIEYFLFCSETLMIWYCHWFFAATIFSLYFCQSSIFYFFQKLWWFGIVSDFLQRPFSRCFFVNRVFLFCSETMIIWYCLWFFAAINFSLYFCQSSIFYFVQKLWWFGIVSDFLQRSFSRCIFCQSSIFYFVQKLWWFGIVSDFLQRPFSRCFFVNRVFFILFRNSDDLVLSLIFCSDHFLAVFLSIEYFFCSETLMIWYCLWFFAATIFSLYFCQSSIFYFVQKLWWFGIVSDFLQRPFSRCFFQSSIFYFVQKLWWFGIASDFLQRSISRCIFVNRVFFILFRNSDHLVLSLIFL